MGGVDEEGGAVKRRREAGRQGGREGIELKDYPRINTDEFKIEKFRDLLLRAIPWLLRINPLEADIELAARCGRHSEKIFIGERFCIRPVLVAICPNVELHVGRGRH